MIGDSCPIPNKKLRTQGSPDHSDSEEWNLSKSFDEDYRILMNEEILQICKQPTIVDDQLEITEILVNFHRGCDELLKLIGNALDKPNPKTPCRSETNLEKFEKISYIERLFKSPRFANINFLANVIIANQPHLKVEVQNKFDELQNVWNLRSLNSDIDFSTIVKDIEADITDLKVWQKEVDKKLNVLIDDRRMDCAESIEGLLNDFKVHDDIINSITKMIEKFIQMDSVMMHNGAVLECKVRLEALISVIHEQWLKAMELKLKLEAMTDMVSHYHLKRNLGINIFGQESGFESEISPLNPTRGLPTNNICIMKYISSSGECLFDNNTTDFPIDSESSSFSVDLAHSIRRNDSSSSSLVGNMMELERSPQTIVKQEVTVCKKQKRLKKRRQLFSKYTEFNCENLSIQEREKYMQIRNAFFKQSHSLKRRISEIDFIQALDRSEETSCRILDLAAAAEKFVMKNDLNQRDYSLNESPKESELDDEDNVIINSANELNVREVWDNYQASLYSNDDGDSQVVEIENIRDWEQDLETDDQDAEGRQLQIHTSGYETSIETETHLCNRNLVNVLKFSTSQHSDANERLNEIHRLIDKCSASTADKIISIINEQLSISNTNVKLLDQIINNDPCNGNQDETVVEHIRLLQREWENLIRKYIVIQSRCDRVISTDPLDKLIGDVHRIHREISTINKCIDVSDCRSSTDFLKEKKGELSNIDAQIANMKCDTRFIGSEKLGNIIDMIESAHANLTTRQNDLKFIKCCLDRFIDHRKKRKTTQNMSVELKQSQAVLTKCLDDLSHVSGEICTDKLRAYLEDELRFLDELDIQLKLPHPVTFDDLQSQMRPVAMARRPFGKPSNPNNSVTDFLRRLPVQVAIFVIAAICGLWYKNQSASSCHASTDWIKLLRNYTNNLEPH